MGQLSTDLHVVRQFISKWAPGFISVVNECWNILARVLIASCYVVSHLSTYFTCWMSFYRQLASVKTQKIISDVKINIGAL